MKYHPIASIFPMLGERELQSLADDIRSRGQVEPVTLYEGMVLDGRNRCAACKIAGVDPSTKTFSGTRSEAVALVWSLNAERRQLTSSQRAIADAKRAKLDEEYAAELQRVRDQARSRQADGGREKVPQKFAEPPDSRTTEAVRAKAVGTNRTYINQADDIVANHPEFVEPVERGEISIDAAHKAAKSGRSPAQAGRTDINPRVHRKKRDVARESDNAVASIEVAAKVLNDLDLSSLSRSEAAVLNKRLREARALLAKPVKTTSEVSDGESPA